MQEGPFWHIGVLRLPGNPQQPLRWLSPLLAFPVHTAHMMLQGSLDAPAEVLCPEV